MHTNRRAEQRQQTGFTLVELLVVVGITAMVMITVSTIFMTFLLSNARTNARRVIQSDGNTAMTQIEFEIRNAKSVTCSGGTTLHVTNGNNETLIIEKNSSTSKLLIGTRVITSQTIVASTGGPTFTCNPTNSQVKVKFGLNINDDFSHELTQNFESTVQVRNTGL